MCRSLHVLRASYARVQATVGVGTVLIWDFGVAYTRGGGAGYTKRAAPFPPLATLGSTCCRLQQEPTHRPLGESCWQAHTVPALQASSCDISLAVLLLTSQATNITHLSEFFLGAQNKVSSHSLLTSQYSR